MGKWCHLFIYIYISYTYTHLCVGFRPRNLIRALEEAGFETTSLHSEVVSAGMYWNVLAT